MPSKIGTTETAGDTLQANNAWLDLLASTTGELLRTDDPQCIIDSICHKVLTFLDCQVFFNHLADKKQGRLHLNACAGLSTEQAKAAEWLEYRASVCGRAAREEGRVVLHELQSHSSRETKLLRSLGLRAYACHPLKAKGEVLGTLSFGTRVRDRFTEKELTAMRIVADQVAVAVERRRGEDALRESEERLRLLGDNLPDCAMYQYVISPDGLGRFTYLSAGIERLTGVKVEEALNDPDALHRLIPPDYLNALAEKQRRCLAELSDFDMDVPQSRRDGEVRWMRLRSRPRPLADGELVWDGVQYDITERKRREMKLAFLAGVSKELGRLTTVRETIQTVAHKAAAHLDLADCQFLDIDAPADRASVIAGWRPRTAGGEAGFALSEFFPRDVRRALRGGKTVAVNEAPCDPVRLAGPGSRSVCFVAVPFVQAGLWKHLLFVTSAMPRQWREDELELLQELTARVFARIERARSEERVRRQNGILAGIGRILGAALTCATEQELGGVCLAVAQEITGSGFGFIGEIGADGLLHDIEISDPGWERCSMREKSGHRNPPGNFPLRGLYGRVLLEGRPLLTNDPARHPASTGLPQGHPPLASFLGVPLFQGEKVIGLLALANRERGYREQDIESVSALCAAVVEAFTRKRAETSMRESQVRLMLALDGGKLGMWEWNLRTQQATWNPMEYELLGLPMGDGHPSTELFFQQVHPDDLPCLIDSIQAALEQCRSWEHEFRVLRPDGEVRWLVGAGHVLVDAEGKSEKMVGVNYDVTERKRIEQELRVAHDTMEQRVRERTVELQALNRELESFCYSVTHELGAPLRGMNCFSNILLEEYAGCLDQEGVDYLKRISAAAGRMGHLIEDLLKLSRVTRRKLSRERVDLSALALKVMCELTSLHPEREVEVRIPHGISGKWDPALAELALKNLLGNAWKYTAKIPAARIEFGSFADGGETVYFVRDNGIGFDMEYAEKIFLPFERLHRVGDYEGTGIGLATVQRVIAMHGGRVWAQGEPDQGATFFFTAD